MRIDKYLKVSRLIKRRTVANEVADAGRILVNGKPAKASYAVKVGDEIEITFGNRPVKVRVLSVDAPAGKDVAREMYEVLEGRVPPAFFCARAHTFVAQERQVPVYAAAQPGSRGPGAGPAAPYPDRGKPGFHQRHRRDPHCQL